MQATDFSASMLKNASYFINNQTVEGGVCCLQFIKATDVAVLMNSASVTYQGKTMYIALTNTTEGIANIQIDTEIEGLRIDKMVLSEQNGYLNSITEEDFSNGATMSSGETVVLRIFSTGEFSTEKSISFIFSNGLM